VTAGERGGDAAPTGPLDGKGLSLKPGQDSGFEPSRAIPARRIARTRVRAVTVDGRSPVMRKSLAALALVVASLAIGEGCAPVPLPHYAAYGPKRVEELLVDSENLRLAGDDWERFWFLDQPSHLTPFRTHGGLGP
jgi:hypothetical protein